MSLIRAHQQLLNGAPPLPPSSWNSAVAALPNLWGWWKVDETSGVGVVAVDSSGNGNDGTYTAAGTSSASGLFAGSSASQTTFGGRVTLPGFLLPAVPVFSIAAFVVANSTASVQSILSADSGQRCWQFRKNASHTLDFVTIQPAVTTSTSATSLNDGNPHLVVLVFDQTLAAASGRVKMYLDGVLDFSSTAAITITGSRTAPIAIASRGSASSSEPWGGAGDEFILLQGALSSSDVAALWASRNL